MSLHIVEDEDGCTFRVRVKPGGRRDEIRGLYGDSLKLTLTAPPERGKANKALQKLLAGKLGVPSSAVEILSGHTSRQKRVRVRGVSPSAIENLLDV